MSRKAHPRTIRAPHGKDRAYFSMARESAQDRGLSWEARGMLCYLLSKPDDWEIQVADLQQNCGRDKVYRVLDELVKARYLKRIEQSHNEKGKFGGMVYQAYEVPCPENPETETPHTDLPHTEKPYTPQPYTAKPTRHNTESTKDETPQKAEEQKPQQPQTPSSGGGSENRPNIYRVYEQNIGMLTPLIGQELKDMVAEFGEAWVEDALKEAVTAEKRNLRFARGVLKNWKRDGRSPRPVIK